MRFRVHSSQMDEPALMFVGRSVLRAESITACKFPGASEMLTKYLIDQAPIRILGYYERVGESAAQYAERLLTGKKLTAGTDAANVAKHLVHHYKDHSFVIDTEEALNLLGADLINEQTP